MTDFAAMWQASMPALDSTFGRVVRIIKRRDDDPYSWSPDPDMPPFEVVGILDTTPLALRQSGGNSERADQPDRISSKCTIDFDIRVFKTPEQIPCEGWRIETDPSPARPFPEAFEVTWRDPSGEGRIYLHVIPVTL